MPRSIRSEGLLALGRAIAEFRASRGMSQEELAAQLGRNQSVVAKLELGVRRLDVVELVVLARVMKVDASDLFKKVEAAIPQSQKF